MNGLVNAAAPDVAVTFVADVEGTSAGVSVKVPVELSDVVMVPVMAALVNVEVLGGRESDDDSGGIVAVSGVEDGEEGVVDTSVVGAAGVVRDAGVVGDTEVVGGSALVPCRAARCGGAPATKIARASTQASDDFD